MALSLPLLVRAAPAMGMGIAYIPVPAFVSFRVWYAGMIRHQEESRQHARHLIEDLWAKHPTLTYIGDIIT